MLTKLLAAYLAAVNLAAFALFALDKRRARRHMWRIPEATLILVSAIGGSLGGLLGMHLLHHKTKHAKFYITVPTLLVLQAAIFGYLFWRIS